ncbi:hypothetical protein H257_12268 [Aphanomyces astaci]|uniref:Uncharacterized protein n=1 Tax=Aphanomyces astaci TaxID=112090 RepID=W4G1X6_APHAT|nr:hypothetical protein H257_12268 [Aphanomyces astaci]ETV72938.1 hypothetical protein H257_12268 [Aphanomyces astaci]|eukprot:XP_009837724.1 hypothetical protein H257_12268 [Aphanomyces astaci]
MTAHPKASARLDLSNVYDGESGCRKWNGIAKFGDDVVCADVHMDVSAGDTADLPVGIRFDVAARKVLWLHTDELVDANHDKRLLQ